MNKHCLILEPGPYAACREQVGDDPTVLNDATVVQAALEEAGLASLLGEIPSVNEVNQT